MEAASVVKVCVRVTDHHHEGISRQRGIVTPIQAAWVSRRACDFVSVQQVKKASTDFEPQVSQLGPPHQQLDSERLRGSQVEGTSPDVVARRIVHRMPALEVFRLDTAATSSISSISFGRRAFCATIKERGRKTVFLQLCETRLEHVEISRAVGRRQNGRQEAFPQQVGI